MANQKVPQLPVLSAVTGEDLLYIVDVSDTTDDPTGSSKQITRDDLLKGISGFTADTISATTYYNLPTDVRVTGATYSNNTFTYTNNTGGTFNVLFNTMTGLTISGNLTVTGGTQSIFSGNSSSDLVRITQTGSGNAFVVEDSVSPDSTAFAISNAGDTGIGIAPDSSFKLKVSATTTAIKGESTNNTGVVGNGYIGVQGNTIYSGYSGYGVQGIANGDGAGVHGWNLYGNGKGVYGQAISGIGVEGAGGTIGVKGSVSSDGSPIGVYGYVTDIEGGGTDYIAGKFEAAAGTNRYSLQLLDGTQGVNKVLISTTSDGKANWSSNLTGLTSVSATTITATTMSVYNLENVNQIDFNTTATTTHLEGRVHWNDEIKSLEIDTDNPNVQIQVGHEMVVRVNNQTGSILTKGTVVFINGEQGQRPTVTKADYSGDSSSASVIGLVASDINDNNNGYVVTNGILEDVNTIAYSAGTSLYLLTGGTYSSIKPQAPNHDVRIGKVIVSNATTGSIYVEVQNGYELEELHDVRITSATTNDVLVRSSYNGIPVWVNTKTLSGLTYVEATSISATTYYNLPTTSLQQAYDDSTSPEIVTNSTLGALSVKNGSGGDDNVTNVFEAVSSSGGVPMFVRGDGFIYGTTFNSGDGFTANGTGLTATTVSATTINTNGLTATTINTNGLTATTISGGTLNISGNTSEDLVRITQTGSGNALVVEDSSNPDSTPFVVNTSGFVGIGVTSPTNPLHISGSTDQIKLSNGSSVWTIASKSNGDFVAVASGTRASMYFGSYGTTNSMRIGPNGAIIVNSSSDSQFTGTGNVIINNVLSATTISATTISATTISGNTYTIASTPSTNSTDDSVLVRNSITGDIEKRSITSLTKVNNTLTVALTGSTGVDFNTIKSAVDSITGATSANTYSVSVAGGIYNEDPFTIPSWVSVVGESSLSTVINAKDSTQTLINLKDQSALFDCQVQGCTGTGVSAIVYSSSTTPQSAAISYVENVRFGTNYTHAKVIGSGSGNIIMQCSNVKYGGYPFTIGFHATNDGSGVGRMQLRNVTSTNGGITTTTGLIFAKTDAANCGFIVNGCLLTKAAGTAAGTGFYVENGGFLRLTAVNFQRWNVGIDVPQIGSAPSIDAIALNFENNNTDVNIAHSGATGKIQGTDNFLKTIININSPLYEVNTDPRQIIVAKKGGDFSSIKSAVDYLIASGNTSSSNRFLISVGPGQYSEGEIDLTSTPYVSIEGSNIQTTLITPTGSTQHIIKIGQNNEVSFLSLSGASAGYAGIYAYDIGDFGQAHKISMYDCDTGIWVESNTQDTVFFGEYIDMNGEYTYGTKSIANNGFVALANLENYYIFPGNSGTTGNYASGTGSTINLTSSSLNGFGTTGSTALDLRDGGYYNLASTDITNWGCGLKVENVGDPSKFEINGVTFADNILDINVLQTSASGSFQGIANHEKVSTLSPNVYWSFLDSGDGELDITRKASVTFADGSHTDLTTLVFEGGPMGLMGGGQLTIVSGLTISTAQGYGYLEITAGEIVRRIDWSATTLTLSSNSDLYIYINENSVLSSSGSRPSSVNNIILGRVVTSSSTIRFIDESPVNAEHMANRYGTLLRNAIGPIYATGSIVTENTTPFHLDVTMGEYYYASNEFMPSGGTNINFTMYYRNGSGGWVTSATTEVIIGYDDNSGTISPLTSSAYTKHTLYVIGTGVYEQYFLVLGQNEYTTLVEAESALLPTPPSFFTDSVSQISNIYVKQSATGITQVEDIRPVIGFKAGGVNASSVHGNLLGLTADDHLQYLRVDGTRAMSGNLNMGTNNIISAGTINGVTIQTHATRHQFGGADPIGTVTPSANAIPFADVNGTLDGWVSTATTATLGKVLLSTSPVSASSPIVVGENDTRFTNSLTGVSYSNNTFTFNKVDGGSLTSVINTVTGWTVNGNLTVTGNTSSDLVKITQTGSGNAFVVEDSASPDTSMFVVDSSGNVGIGTNSPISKLQISNTATTVSSTLYNATNDFVTLTAQGAAPGFNIVSAGDAETNRGVIKATRARGTLTTPLVPILNDDTLSLIGAIYDGVTNYSTAGITFEVDGTVTASTAPQRIVLSTGTGSTRTERMRIDSEGNVGIGTGTLSPQSPLHVRANSVPSTNETILRLDVLDSPTAYFAINNGSTIDGVFVPEIIGRQASTTGLNAATIGGYIDPLQDSGTTVPVTIFRSAVAGGSTISTRPIFDFRNWTTSVMLMSASGDVGIGTTNPSEKLHVSGNAIITGTTTSGTLSATTISGGTMVITSTPTTDNTNTQVLTRDPITGIVELVDISTIGGGSFNYGLVNAMMTGNFLT